VIVSDEYEPAATEPPLHVDPLAAKLSVAATICSAPTATTTTASTPNFLATPTIVAPNLS
jgi:hypothetical protein